MPALQQPNKNWTRGDSFKGGWTRNTKQCWGRHHWALSVSSNRYECGAGGTPGRESGISQVGPQACPASSHSGTGVAGDAVRVVQAKRACRMLLDDGVQPVSRQWLFVNQELACSGPHEEEDTWVWNLPCKPSHASPPCKPALTIVHVLNLPDLATIGGSALLQVNVNGAVKV